MICFRIHWQIHNLQILMLNVKWSSIHKAIPTRWKKEKENRMEFSVESQSEVGKTSDRIKIVKIPVASCRWYIWTRALFVGKRPKEPGGSIAALNFRLFPRDRFTERTRRNVGRREVGKEVGQDRTKRGHGVIRCVLGSGVSS